MERFKSRLIFAKEYELLQKYLDLNLSFVVISQRKYLFGQCVKEGGFAPVVCSNEGCEFVVNQRDLIHHESVVCERRRVSCHNCAELQIEMDTVKKELNKKLHRTGACPIKYLKEERFPSLPTNIRVIELTYNIPRDLRYVFYKINFNEIFIITNFSSRVPKFRYCNIFHCKNHMIRYSKMDHTTI